MPHPFKDKLVVFIGNPVRCSRQEARDALASVGDVVDERITMFTHYVVAFSGAEKTKVFQKAVERDRYGYLVLLDESQFFAVLEGRAEPPAKKVFTPDESITVIPAKDQESAASDHEQTEQYLIAKKRIKNLAQHGVPTSDGGRIKIDFESLESMLHYIELARKNAPHDAGGTSDEMSDLCDSCGQPAKVHIGDGEGGILIRLCGDCHNRLMARYAGIELPVNIPKRLDFRNDNGEIRSFEIEFEIHGNGKSITATEIGKLKLKEDVFGELDEDFYKMLETLTERIKKMLSVIYMNPDGHFALNKAVGYIEYNPVRDDNDIIIDGKPYTWEELKKNISAREGWKIKIEFGDVGDELD